MTSINESFYKTLIILMAIVTLIGVFSPQSFANEREPSWKVKSSERLVKMPPRYLNKSLDQDFSESSLGQAFAQSGRDLNLKGETLKDLQAAVRETDGEIKVEMRHQFLIEKKTYIEIMSDRNEMRRKKIKTKLKVVEAALDNLVEKNAPISKVRRDLITNQDAARERFSSSLEKVDMKLFQSANIPQSKYAMKHAKNIAAIEQLMKGINSHKMSNTNGRDGEKQTKEEYLRQMVADAESELALIEQENAILGYMAKLVALDAMDLSEQAMDADLATLNTAGGSSINPSQAVTFFINN